MRQINAFRRAAAGAICAAAIGMASGSVYGQTPSASPQSNAQPGHSMRCMMAEQRDPGAMMGQRQQRMEQMQAFDQKLNDLIARMNAAEGPAKADAVAAVVSELIAQRAHMRGEMMAMQAGAMDAKSCCQSGDASMECCPMMKGVAQPAQGDAHQHEIK
jgi:hypothetical protein